MHIPTFSTSTQKNALRGALLLSLLHNGAVVAAFLLHSPKLGTALGLGLFRGGLAQLWAAAFAVQAVRQREEATAFLFGKPLATPRLKATLAELEAPHLLVLALLCSPFALWALRNVWFFLGIFALIYGGVLRLKGFRSR